MDKKTWDALKEEMPSIVRHINRIIASNPDLRDSGLKYSGLVLKTTEPNPDIVRSKAAFRKFIQPECQDFKLCLSEDEQTQISICADQDCPFGFHDA